MNPKIIKSESIANDSNEHDDTIEGKVYEFLKPPVPTKNKWLYPTDSFGKMEKGRADD